MYIRQLSAVLAILAASSRASPMPQESSGPTVLNPDDIVVVGADNSVQIMKDYEYDQLVRRAESASIKARASAWDEVAVRDMLHENRPRGCEESEEIQVLTDETFLNWDTAVSPVASAAGGDATVTITDGYSLANSVTVSAGASLGPIEKLLTINFHVDYSETWTTTQTQGFLFKVPEGQFGLVVTQANVRRITGNYLSGCTDNWEKTSFSSDSYTSQSYGDLSWVQGIIRLCNSTSYPVPYCIGEGSHY